MLHRLFILLCLCSNFQIVKVTAQASPVSSGNDFKGTGGTVAWSVGQVFYTAPSGNVGSTTQGVQQPYEIFIVSQTSNIFSGAVVVYPNPTLQTICLKADFEPDGTEIWQLYNINGQLLSYGILNNNQTNISMEDFSSGVYMLKFEKGKKLIKEFKIVKQ